MGAHLIGGQFKSDKYPDCPAGKVPLSVKDTTAQDLLWEYAQRRRAVDAEFADDLETALRSAGYVPYMLPHYHESRDDYHARLLRELDAGTVTPRQVVDIYTHQLANHRGWVQNVNAVMKRLDAELRSARAKIAALEAATDEGTRR